MCYRYALKSLAATRGFLGIIVIPCLVRGADDMQDEIVVLPGDIIRNFLGLAGTIQYGSERSSPPRQRPDFVRPAKTGGVDGPRADDIAGLEVPISLETS
jgi:hypothetical protein